MGRTIRSEIWVLWRDVLMFEPCRDECPCMSLVRNPVYLSTSSTGFVFFDVGRLFFPRN